LKSVFRETLMRLFSSASDQFEKRVIKYGVVQTDHLVADLLDWEQLYLAGRLHKPCRFVVQARNRHELNEALALNLKSACHAALLLLPERFSYGSRLDLSRNYQVQTIFGLFFETNFSPQSPVYPIMVT